MASKASNPASVIAQAKKNLGNTGPAKAKVSKMTAKPKGAVKPKLPAQNRNLVNQQKKINKTSMW